MSGFGNTGGFGSGFGGSTGGNNQNNFNNNNAPPFGTANAGFGFGNNAASAPAPAGFGGSGGFGSSTATPSNPFAAAPTGGAMMAPAPSGFGQPPTTPTANTSGGFGGFGGAQATPAPATGFASSGFGNASSGFGGNSQSGFGSASTPSAGGFGSDNNSGGFQSNSNTGFGSSTNASWGGANSSTAASGSASDPFAQSSGASGFGNTASSGSGFGSSKPSGGSGFGGQGSGAAWGSSNAPNPFAAQPNNQDSGMEGDHSFGMSDAAAPPPPAFGRAKTGFGKGLASVPEQSNPNASGDKKEASLKAKMEEKKRLQAMIEEKKRKLLEKQKQKRSQSPTRDASKDAAAVAPPAPSLNPQASVFVPSANTKSAKASKMSSENKSLAERNAVRFGDQGKDRAKTRGLLPADMRAPAAAAPADASSDPHATKPTEREDLENAVALHGTCEFFCPDEELLRRERESDIQPLEMPMPGKLHPQDWTLRNTAVKRFRRSAADYKLDVPEWVRPPDVLEKVCGYLEEWVMDRDRQGPDPRYPNGEPPPCLEVYRFIWDRTRMIRKDFTLQNYVGTGGQCDARAVRCHERIARWHAMCEHQLSHLEDFVTMQSQQNIQELGQTMKTLNQFYDDSLNRSIVEVPDKEGRETRKVLAGFSHGCTVENVQGTTPVDFDGQTLNNDTEGARIQARIVGSHAVQHPSHGTAEPEMRGIYILLTMNNEGGMEVLKYAAKLFQERPKVYHSKPVQLALEIFKAKKEYNYARFFSLLRAPTTPYLFCCIMFKHVELMRKIAFRIMSKTFGARKKDTGEGVYDAYPMNRLVELLCFQDIEEARAACQHYNITVKAMKASSSREETTEIVFWRGSDFKEPKHPTKGFVLPLQPKKITRIIERKLNGASRLAVCRGEVSGEGATLYPMSSQAMPVATAAPPAPSFEESERAIAASEKAKAAELLKKQKLEAARLEKEARIEAEKKRRQAEEQKKKLEEEKKRKEAEARQAELERQRQEKLELLKRIKEEEMRQQKAKEEAERKAAEQRALEAKRRQLEEEARRKKLEEEARRREELARQKELERQRAIEAQKRREEEERRQERIRKEFEAKRKRLEEERRIEREWQERVEKAERIILWKRLKKSLLEPIRKKDEAIASLRELDPTFSTSSLQLGQQLQATHRQMESPETQVEITKDVRWALEQSIREDHPKLSVAALANRFASSPDVEITDKPPETVTNTTNKLTLLLKVAVLIPSHSDDEASERMKELLETWLASRLKIGQETRAHSMDEKSQWCEVRSFVKFAGSYDACADCDVALVIVPPPWSTTPARRALLEETAECLENSVPRVAMVLGNEFDFEGHEYMKTMLAKTLGGDDPLPIICNSGVSSEALEMTLAASCKNIARMFVDGACVKIERISVPKLAARAVSTYLWNQNLSEDDLDGNVVLKGARFALSSITKEAELQTRENQSIWASWPPEDFLSSNRRSVLGYFGVLGELPGDWHSSLDRRNLEDALSWMSHRLHGSFRDVVESLLFDAPKDVREECNQLFAKAYYRRCLETALNWFADYGSNDSFATSFVYFPHGLMDYMLSRLTSRLPMESIPQLVPDTRVSILSEVGESAFNSQTKGQDASNQEGTNETSNKRRRSSGNDEDDDDVLDPVVSPFPSISSGKKRRSSLSKPTSKSSKELQDSFAFSKRLEELVSGGTIDCAVGDTYLSRLLKNAPKLTTPEY